MNLKQKLATIATSAAMLLGSTAQAFAQLTNPVVEGSLGNNDAAASSGSTFANYFVSLWKAIMAIGAIVVIIFFIWGAVEWIASGGDKGKIESARNRITQAVIGLIILVGSYVIIGFISDLFFGGSFNILQPELPGVGKSKF